MAIRNAQKDYSSLVSAVLEQGKRNEKGQMILNILVDYFSGKNKNSMRFVDFGCSSDVISYVIAPALGFVDGSDIDIKALQSAVDNIKQERTNLKIIASDAMDIPFGDNTFDIVICNHIYAHVQDSEHLSLEIERILAPSGICYFAGGNRLNIIEENYRRAFLFWLPNFLACLLLNLAKGIYPNYEKHLTLWELKKSGAVLSEQIIPSRL
jgi:SAM-dependent methyltransferase